MTLRLPLLLSLAALTVGCPSTAPAPLTGGEAYAFPHAEGFSAGTSHGAPWIASPTGCEQCHRSEQRIRFVRTCGDCHDAYPHPEGFADPALHGPLGLDGGAACVACHGTGEATPGGAEGAACRSCHQDYPHRLTWAEPQVHGPIAQDRIETCAGCHGDDWAGSASVDGCRDCHARYPHASRDQLLDTAGPLWADPSVHGAAALTDGVATCGGTCHGADYAGGLSDVSCRSCHAPFPHGDDYLVQHRADTLAYGESTCLDCHVQERGFPADFTCAETCHGGTE